MNTSVMPSDASAAAPRYARDVILPLAMYAFALLLPLSWFVSLFLAVGQAHLWMAFIYQMRSKKTRKAYYFPLAFVLLVISTAYALYVGNVAALFAATAILSAMHAGADEFLLRGETLSGVRRFVYAAFVLFFAQYFLTFAVPSLGAFTVPVDTALFVVFAARLLFARQKASLTEKYLMFECVLLFGFSFVGMPIQAFGVCLLIHFVAWYAYYGEKVESNPVEKKRYWSTMSFTLALSLCLFALYSFFNVAILALLFLPFYYDFWAIAHVVLSSRLIKSPAA